MQFAFLARKMANEKAQNEAQMRKL